MMMIIVHGIGSRTVKFSAVVMIMSRIVVIIWNNESKSYNEKDNSMMSTRYDIT